MDSGVKTLAQSPSRRPAANPWGTSPHNISAPCCSLSAVIDEELAKKIQQDEETAARLREDHVSLDPGLTSDDSLDTSSDLLLAQMLQLEYDREHDRQLMTEEKHFNMHNKGQWYKREDRHSMCQSWEPTCTCTRCYMYLHVHVVDALLI